MAARVLMLSLGGLPRKETRSLMFSFALLHAIARGIFYSSRVVTEPVHRCPSESRDSGAGEMTWLVRGLPALTRHQGGFPAPRGSTQSPVTSVLGHLSDLCMLMCVFGAHTYTHMHKIKFKIHI